MTREEALEVLKGIVEEAGESEEAVCYVSADEDIDALNMAMQALEQIESGRYIKGECSICSNKYGTLGCCTTVSNHWVYSCKEGMAQYAEALKQEPKNDCISRTDTLEILDAMANVDKDNAKVYSKIYSQIKDAPSVVPKGSDEE